MTYIIYGVIAALSTSVFFRLGAVLRNHIPQNFHFPVGIMGVMGLQILTLALVLGLHFVGVIGGNKFLNLALSIPVSVGFGLGILKGVNSR